MNTQKKQSDEEVIEVSDTAMSIADTINDILEDRGIYDGGKNFGEDVQERIMPKIEQLTQQAKREVVEELRLDGKDIILGNYFENETFRSGYIRANKDIKSLLITDKEHE